MYFGTQSIGGAPFQITPYGLRWYSPTDKVLFRARRCSECWWSAKVGRCGNKTLTLTDFSTGDEGVHKEMSIHLALTKKNRTRSLYERIVHSIGIILACQYDRSLFLPQRVWAINGRSVFVLFCSALFLGKGWIVVQSICSVFSLSGRTDTKWHHRKKWLCSQRLGKHLKPFHTTENDNRIRRLHTKVGYYSQPKVTEHGYHIHVHVLWTDGRNSY